MPGIYGLAGFADSDEQLRRMKSAMRLYGHFRQDDLFSDDVIGASRVHLGHVGENSSPVVEGSLLVWVEGEAYNVVEVAATYGLHLPDKSLAKLLLVADAAGRLDDCLNRLDGYFCAAIYDKAKRTVRLVSDRYGMRLLYWYHKGSEFAWSSGVKGVLAINRVDKTIDPGTFDCFMDLGYMLGEHTWFKHIKLLKPASILECSLDTGDVSQRYYWKWSEIQPASYSFDDAVDALGETFIAAVSRRFDPTERIGISLSGGLDSRVILAAVDYLYPDYNGYAYTFGVPECDDITIAREVVARTNWRHDEFHFSADNWLAPRWERVWNTDGMMNLKHMHGSEFAATISENIDINLNGYCGDVIFGGGFLTKLTSDQRLTERDARTVYGDYSALADIDDTFYDIPHGEPNLHMNRVRRFTNYGTKNVLPWLDQRKPFFDNTAVELVYSLPDSYRAKNKLYAAMLQRYFPKFFKDIPWQNTGKPAGILGKRSIPERAVSRLRRTTMAYLGRQDSKGYTDYSSWIRTPEISQELARLLDPEMARYSMVTGDDLAAKWLLPHLSWRVVDNSEKILRAATVESYLRHVFS